MEDIMRQIDSRLTIRHNSSWVFTLHQTKGSRLLYG